MYDLSALVDALVQLWSLQNLFFILIGVSLGVVIGALPGLGAPLGIAIALPFTFYLDAPEAFALLLGIYSAATYGGSISAIVLGIPGTASAAATTMDGHPLYKNGKGSQALTLSLIGSMFGGMISTVILIALAPIVASFALKFGPPAYFALGVFGVSVVALISGDSLLKGAIMGSIGIFLTMIGIDSVNGSVRFVFGVDNLYAGIPFIPLLVGVFALPEMLEKSEDLIPVSLPKGAGRIRRPRVNELLKFKGTFFRSSIIGTVIGTIPGGGGAIGSFVSYGLAKRISKNPERFGKGEPEGLVAAEVANNSTVGGALIPTLTLGVPGSASAAILLGAFLIQGVMPGPRLIEQSPTLVYYIFISLFVINIMMLIVGWLAIKSAGRIIQVPDRILIPVVLLLAFVGSYTTSGSLFGVWVMLLIGLACYVLRKFRFPLVPAVLGFILGDMIETNFRQSLTLSDGSWAIFVTKPIAVSIFALLVASLAGSAMLNAHRRRRNRSS